MINFRSSLFNKFMRLAESWNEEPVGISITADDVNDELQEKCLDILKQHTPRHEDNCVTEKHDADAGTQYAFLRICHPRHYNTISDIANMVKDDYTRANIKPHVQLVYDELDAKLLEWSIGNSCNLDCYSEVVLFLPGRPCGYVTINGWSWDEDEQKWMVCDISEGAADCKQLWKVLRKHMFSTGQPSTIASFDWLA